MPDLGALPLSAVIAIFAAAAAVIAVAGVWMVGTADRLADRTGLGEAITGAVLLGAATSLSGTIASITAAADGYPNLAVANAIGGIAVQTFFLGLADILYRKANLEHAAASPTNLLQAALLLTLLPIPLLAMVLPETTLLGVHPASPVLVAVYILGLRLARSVQAQPLWGPTRTPETHPDTPAEPRGGTTMRLLLLRFAALVAVLSLAGFAVARSGKVLAVRTGMNETLVGALLTAIATSLPELVTTLAAVRRRALTLAVGGIIGGNSFDVLFLALSDAAYRDGSIYHVFGNREIYIVCLCMVMTAVLLLGLVRRERYGFAKIGFESLLILLLYLFGVAGLFLLL